MLDPNKAVIGDPVPLMLRGWLQPWRAWFTAPSWEHVLVLVMGAVLATGKRTVTSCLRVTGRAEAANFASYHQILNRARWSSRAAARRLLGIIVERLVPDGPVVIGMDATIERRWPPDQRAGNIPGPGALQSRPFRQSQPAVLVELHGAHSGIMDQPDQGVAGPDAARAFGAIQPAARLAGAGISSLPFDALRGLNKAPLQHARRASVVDAPYGCVIRSSTGHGYCMFWSKSCPRNH